VDVNNTYFQFSEFPRFKKKKVFPDAILNFPEKEIFQFSPDSETIHRFVSIFFYLANSAKKSAGGVVWDTR
jgi:hypothetical protein